MYFVIHCKASSLTSFRKSWSNLQLSSLVSTSKGSLLRLDKPTSIGITTFLPKASLNGVSLVGVLVVVQHVHNTPGSSSSHAPFTPPQVEPWWSSTGSDLLPPSVYWPKGAWGRRNGSWLLAHSINLWIWNCRTVIYYPRWWSLDAELANDVAPHKVLAMGSCGIGSTMSISHVINGQEEAMHIILSVRTLLRWSMCAFLSLRTLLDNILRLVLDLHESPLSHG